MRILKDWKRFLWPIVLLLYVVSGAFNLSQLVFYNTHCFPFSVFFSFFSVGATLYASVVTLQNTQEKKDKWSLVMLWGVFASVAISLISGIGGPLLVLVYLPFLGVYHLLGGNMSVVLMFGLPLCMILYIVHSTKRDS